MKLPDLLRSLRGSPAARRRSELIAAALLGIGVAPSLWLGQSAPNFDYLTAPVERGDIVSFVTATGTVTPVGQVNVGSQLSGRIAEIAVDFNDHVTRGQALARLDPEGFEALVREAEAGLELAEANMLMQEAALDKAEADLSTARGSRAVRSAETAGVRAQREEADREFARLRTLAQEAVISGSDVDRARARAETSAALLRAAETQEVVGDAAARGAEASVKMALANLQNAVAEVKRRAAGLERARVDLDRSTIRAPIDGVVIGRSVESGQTVAASLEAPTLFTLASDLRKMEVRAQIDQADIGRIVQGQSVVFAVDAYPERAFSGTVTQVRKAPHMVQNVVTYAVIVSAENPDLLLLPGMTAILRVLVTEIHDVLKVPNAAFRFRPPERIAAPAEARAARGELGMPERGNPALVWVLEDAEPTPRVVGFETGDVSTAAVVGGLLEQGDLVIVGATTPEASALGLRLGQ